MLLAAFGFSNAVIRGFLGAQDRVTVLFGVCVAAACVLVAALARKGMIEIKALYQIAVPVLVAGALLVLMGYGWSGRGGGVVLERGVHTVLGVRDGGVLRHLVPLRG